MGSAALAKQKQLPPFRVFKCTTGGFGPLRDWTETGQRATPVSGLCRLGNNDQHSHLPASSKGRRVVSASCETGPRLVKRQFLSKTSLIGLQ